MGSYSDYLDKKFGGADLHKERKKQLRRVAKLRRRHVLVIAADVQNRLAVLGNEDLLAIRDQLSNIDGGDAIDVILETPGGSGEAAEDIVRLIRGRFSSMGVIVPGSAKSAGTILAMAGDEILMSDESGLGPIDAQISHKGKVFSAHALLQGMDQIKQEIEETGSLNRIHIPMLQNLSPGELQHARNVQDFAVELEPGMGLPAISSRTGRYTVRSLVRPSPRRKSKAGLMRLRPLSVTTVGGRHTDGRSRSASLHKLGLRDHEFRG